MKTFTKSTALLITALAFSTILSAKGFEMEPETYVDDIPFNTELIAAQVLYEQAVAVEFYLEEEEYINDIPFNTDSLAKVGLSNQALAQEFSIEDETYIDDIPFDTNKVVWEYSQRNCTMLAKNK